MKDKETAQYEEEGMGLVYPVVPGTESPSEKPQRHMLT